MIRAPFIRIFFTSLVILVTSPFAINSEGLHTESGFSQEKRYDTFSLEEEAVMPLNKHVTQFVKNYIQSNRDELYTIEQRSRSPFAMIDSVFRRYKLPVQLKYLAVIESDLKATAVSRVGAAGPWQLMPQTAQLLGLKVTQAYDERKQYYKSTKAAAIYLKDLYAEFGDWLLVLAAYNGGPGPVYRAIHKAGSRNFWNLQSYLPLESRLHVKKFIAAHYYFESQGYIAMLTRTDPPARL